MNQDHCSIVDFLIIIIFVNRIILVGVPKKGLPSLLYYTDTTVHIFDKRTVVLLYYKPGLCCNDNLKTFSNKVTSTMCYTSRPDLLHNWDTRLSDRLRDAKNEWKQGNDIYRRCQKICLVWSLQGVVPYTYSNADL